MRIYLAAKFESRDSLRPVRDRLWALGHAVVSSWLDEVERPKAMSKEAFYRKLAIKDLTEIESADLLVLCTLETSDRGGAATEFGFALGRHQKMLVYVVGPKRSVFHELADMTFESWEEFLAFETAAAPGQIDESGTVPVLCGMPDPFLRPPTSECVRSAGALPQCGLPVNHTGLHRHQPEKSFHCVGWH